jgi:sortase A
MNPESQPSMPIWSVRRTVLRSACSFFMVLGLAAVGYASFVLANARTFQAIEKEKFAQEKPLAELPVLADDDVIGEMQVPRLGLDVMVVQGDSAANLRRAVAHITKSALPGEEGNVALAGHRDTFFRPLQYARLGDQIRFRTRERSFNYVVESIEVARPNAFEVLRPSGGHELTLVTCYPFYYVGSAPKRLVVHAREVDAP